MIYKSAFIQDLTGGGRNGGGEAAWEAAEVSRQRGGGGGGGGWGGVGRGVRDLGEKNGRSCAGRVMPSA